MRTVLLVHGMGQTTAKEFRQEFVNGLTAALDLYELKSKWDESEETFAINYDGSAWEKTRVVAFGYNDFFETRRERVADESKAVLDRLNGIGLVDKPERRLAEGLAKLSASFGKDKFFQTHFGDVLLYAYTTVGAQVRASLAEKITAMIATGTAPSEIHVIAHSLGTSVTHDTLAMLSAKHKERTDTQLNIVTHRIGSLHLIANVSEILDVYVSIDQSYVRPGRNGCVSKYYQYNNRFDPFTRVAPFKPRNDGSWISKGTFKNHYASIATNDVTGGNPHALSHYLLDPVNSSVLFPTAFNVDVNARYTDAIAAYDKLTAQQVAKDAKQALKAIDIKEEKSIKNLEKAMKALSAYLKKIRADWSV